MTLVSAFTTEAADQRIVSPLFCGSHPYLHGSLTYRFIIFKIPLPILFVNGTASKKIYIFIFISSIIELEKEEFL